MQNKIVGIAAGEAHTLALTDDGSVFSWGKGYFGRLGTGKEDDELIPVRVAFGNGERGRPQFVGVAAGAYHSLALQDDGSVWSWGYNIYGQLGYGEEDSSSPCLIERFQELGSPDSLADKFNLDHEAERLKVSSIKAGGMTSLAIDRMGGLWMWGNCPQPTDDGKFCLVSTTTPFPVCDFHGRTVVKVACGNEHVIAAVSTGETYTEDDLVCYAWGNNSHGQLGLGDTESRACPQAVASFNPESQWVIKEIACGAFHSALLTHTKSDEKESKCWTFGLGDNGQLGHGTTISTSVPEPVTGIPRDSILISLDCGLFHTSVVSSAGDVWCWGTERGLGLCPDASFMGTDAGDALSPLRIQSNEENGFRFAGPIHITCGAAHTVLVAGDGYKLWAWGRGRSGVLGRGQTSDSYIPCLVSWPPVAEDNKDRTATSDEVGSTVEMDRKMEEVSSLRAKLTLMERYATVLHVSIFRKALDERNLSPSLQGSAVFDIGKELEDMMESADSDELARMEMFYRSMLSNVKDKLMKRRIRQMVEESLVSLSKGSRS